MEPVRPAAGYIGGKKQLARRIIERIETIPHDTHAEPFAGMGGVFFQRRFAPPGEVLNDRPGDVATFFRVLQRHYVPFMEMLRWQITSRREFERLKASDPATLMLRAVPFVFARYRRRRWRCGAQPSAAGSGKPGTAGAAPARGSHA